MKFLNKSVTVRRILKNIPKSDTSIYSVLLRQPAKQVFAVAFGSSFFYGSFCEDLFLLLPFGSSFFMDLFMEVFFCCCLLAAVFFIKKQERMEEAMHLTGLEDTYVIKYNKKLRCGYTTGSCAAGAAKAAAQMLLSGEKTAEVFLHTPKGIRLNLQIEDVSVREEEIACAVRKDGGDDPDVTNGILVYASVRLIPEKEIRIEGGRGVGRVTKRGLQQRIGEAAINPVPRKMIAEALWEAAGQHGYKGGFSVEIFVPEGEKIAQKTFNPKLGIAGGISILGTSGIVIPMSEKALIASIRVEMEMLKAEGYEYLVITPGNYGESFAKEQMPAVMGASMKCSNYIGETMNIAEELGIKGILFVSHIGKFIKVAGGIMNTHSREADCRAELMAAFALRAGADRKTASAILDTITTDEALEIMEQAGIMKDAMQQAVQRIQYYLQNRVQGRLETEIILFSNTFGHLAQTDQADVMLEKIKNAEVIRDV